jgi:hypothetical protein
MALDPIKMGDSMYEHLSEGKTVDTATETLAKDSMHKMAGGIVEHLDEELSTEFVSLYDATQIYAQNDPCFYLGIPYRSLQNSNTGHTPDSSPTYWEVTGGGGLTEVAHDTTLDGTGVAGDPLTVLDSPHADSADNVSGIVAIENGGTGQAAKESAFDALSPLSTQGDLLYHTGTHNARLAAGADNQILKLSAGVPGWADESSSPSVGTDIGINFANGQFEATATGWNTYKDAAQTTPVDGTGGTATLTAVRSTSSPLFGVGDLLVTKAASNLQGEGVSYDFTIDPGLLGQTLKLTFFYKVLSGTYVDNDIGVYIYDITNANLMYPSIVNLPGAGGSVVKYEATFIPSNSLSYRLILHVQTVSTSAYVLKADNFEVSTQKITSGAAIGNWNSYTPSITGCGTCSNVSFRYRRVGSSIEVSGTFTTGTVQGSAGGISLPTIGITISSSINSPLVVGQWSEYLLATSTDKQGAMCANYSVYSNIIAFSGGGYATNNPPNSTGTWITSIFSNNQNISVYFSVPIDQWTSNVNLASDFTEYAYNTSTATNADDTSSFGYGLSGAKIQAITAQLRRTVRFTRDIQPTDKIDIEISADGITWGPVPFLVSGTVHIFPYTMQGGATYGVGIDRVAGSKNQVIIMFGVYSYTSGATYASAGTPWNPAANYYWRVRKVSNGNMAEQLEQDTFEVFGVARCTAGTWSLIEDTEHKVKNITSISNLSDGGFRVTYPTAARVGSLVTTPDETYAQYGYSVGSSVGLSYSDVYVCGKYVDLVPSTRMALWLRRSSGVYGYVYFNGSLWTSSDSAGLTSYSFDTATGVLTINHSGGAGLAEISIVPRCFDSYDEAAFFSYSATATYVKFFRTGRVPNAQLGISGSNVWILGSMYR